MAWILASTRQGQDMLLKRGEFRDAYGENAYKNAMRYSWDMFRLGINIGAIAALVIMVIVWNL